MGMSPALEIRGLHKHFVAGAGACHASAAVLRGIDLIVRCGECVAIVGDSGSGKSTLMFCVAGLVTPSAGEVRWFGDHLRAAASTRVVYHVTVGEMIRSGAAGEPQLHLLDLAAPAALLNVEPWIQARCASGDCVIVCSRDQAAVRHLAARVYWLRGGALHAIGSPAPTRARVAEHRPV
jgi:ABC-type polysaccharide/polyol phosphate transport system ATPase subunit